MHNNLRFHEILPITRKCAEKMLLSNEQSTTINTLLSLSYYDPDWKWVQEKCISFLNNEDSEIRRIATLCLGHIARIHHVLDKDRVMSYLKKLRNDPDLSGTVDDVISDIEIFVGR